MFKIVYTFFAVQRKFFMLYCFSYIINMLKSQFLSVFMNTNISRARKKKSNITLTLIITTTSPSILALISTYVIVWKKAYTEDIAFFLLPELKVILLISLYIDFLGVSTSLWRFILTCFFLLYQHSIHCVWFCTQIWFFCTLGFSQSCTQN